MSIFTFRVKDILTKYNCNYTPTYRQLYNFFSYLYMFHRDYVKSFYNSVEQEVTDKQIVPCTISKQVTISRNSTKLIKTNKFNTKTQWYMILDYHHLSITKYKEFNWDDENPYSRVMIPIPSFIEIEDLAKCTRLCHKFKSELHDNQQASMMLDFTYNLWPTVINPYTMAEYYSRSDSRITEAHSHKDFTTMTSVVVNILTDMEKNRTLYPYLKPTEFKAKLHFLPQLKNTTQRSLVLTLMATDIGYDSDLTYRFNLWNLSELNRWINSENVIMAASIDHCLPLTVMFLK